MTSVQFTSSGKYLINTGNILSLNDITRKSGQNPTEELSEAINITLKEYQSEIAAQENGKVVIHRPNDDLIAKIGEQSLTDLKIGLKIFLNDDKKVLVKEAIEEGFKALNVSSVHNVVLSFKKATISENEDELASLKKIWTVLEEYVKNDKIIQIGVADFDEILFRNLYEWANIKPTIIQINLATCCVVPPSLQTFCKDNEVLLLTHSDPPEFLPKATIKDSLGVSLPVKWVLRFLVHIKCRGVLITKGYLVNLGE